MDRLCPARSALFYTKVHDRLLIPLLAANARQHLGNSATRSR
jgi:hypothetical protein